MLFGLPYKLIGMVAGALAVVAFVLLAFHWKHQASDRKEQLAVICTATRSASKRPKLDCGQVPQQIQFLGDALNSVRAKTAAAKAEDAAHAREVESRQNIASKESSHDYQTELARVRADYAERVRSAARRAAQGGGGNSPVPGAPAVAGGPVAAAPEGRLPPPDALIATEQALQLQAILEWGKKVGVVAK